MFRRAIGAAALLVLMLVAAGCPAAPPPPNPRPPVIDLFALSSETVEAGSTFTVSIAATDERAVRSISLAFVQPSGAGYSPIVCTVPAGGGAVSNNTLTLAPALPSANVQFVCAMPAAPNGTWKVTATVYDGVAASNYPTAQASFEVVGGSDDQTPPVLDSVVVTPSPLVVGSKFNITVRISDDSVLANVPAKPSMYYTSSYGRPCYEPTLNQISATVQEWVFPCQPNTDKKPGEFRGYVTAYDSAGNTMSEAFKFNMVAPA